MFNIRITEEDSNKIVDLKDLFTGVTLINEKDIVSDINNNQYQVSRINWSATPVVLSVHIYVIPL